MTTYNRANFTVDTGTALKASGAITASAAVATILDLGEAFAEGYVVIDVTAIDIAGTDERYEIVVQLSPDATFGTDTNIVDRCMISLGHATPKLTDCNRDDTIGRYLLPVDNVYDDVLYRYMRLYTVCTGATASITYSAQLAKRLG